MPKELAIVIPIIRSDFIIPCLETLYRYTEKDSFYVILVDQTPDGVYEKVKDKVHLYLRPNRNLGFSKAANEGIIHAKRWGVPYIGVLNDDTEFINSKWFQGVKDEFATDPKILCVNPESPRVPLWGYGRDSGDNVDILPYKQQYTEEDWDYLCKGEYEDMLQRYPRADSPADKRIGTLPPAFPLKKAGVIDAIAMWFPIFKNEFFDKVGYFDEKFFPGGGEDYSLNARGYSCAWPIERDECDPQYHYRLVSTMKSWVWHHWGQSKDRAAELPESLELFNPERRWNDIDALWPPELNQGHKVDPWAHYTDDQGIKRPFKRVKEVHIEPL